MGLDRFRTPRPDLTPAMPVAILGAMQRSVILGAAEVAVGGGEAEVIPK